MTALCAVVVAGMELILESPVSFFHVHWTGFVQGHVRKRVVRRKTEAEGKALPSSARRKLVQRYKTERKIAIETRRKASEKNTGWELNNIDQPQRQ